MNLSKRLLLKGRGLTILCASLLLVSVAVVFARSLAQPPAREAFIGAWQGYSKSHLEFARLELDDNGTGFLAISYLPQSPAVAYRVTNWVQRGFNLDMTAIPAGPDAEAVTFRDIRYGIESISLELRGNGWDRKMILFSEVKLQKRTSDASERLKNLNLTTNILNPADPQKFFILVQ
jgi:hypothetical protein